MPNQEIEGQITFFYYRNLQGAVDFYENIMGFELAVDQGWSKIFKASDNAYVGVVDERYGYHKASPTKPVMLTLLVPDVDAWYRHFEQKGVISLSQPHDNDELGIRTFLLEDPEGYVIEIQKFKHASG